MTIREQLTQAVNGAVETIATLTRQVTEILSLVARISDPIPDSDPMPKAPTDLVARLDPTDSRGLTCELVWTHVHTEGVDTHFEIQVGDSDKGSVAQWNTLVTLTGDVSTFEHVWGELKDRNFVYRVRAINRAGFMSDWSNVADPEEFVIQEPDPQDPVDTNGYTRVAVGTNFAGKKGKYLLPAGTYPAFEPESEIDLLFEDGAKIEFKSGQQMLHRGAADVTFRNFLFDGKQNGGKDKKLNDNAMIVPGDGWRFIKGRITGSQGVNVGCDGKNIRFIDVESDDGGSAGIGGKADGSLLTRVYCHHNNIRVKDRDGAVFGKWTRTNGQLFIDCKAEFGTCCGNWHDISNSNIGHVRFQISNITLAASDRGWTAAGFKEEISSSKDDAPNTLLALAREAGVLRDFESLDGITEVEIKSWNYIYKECRVFDTYAYCADWNETRDIFWHGGELAEGKDKTDGGSVGVRDLTRADAKAKGMEKNWVFDNLYIKGVKARTGTLSIGKSSAGNKITIAGNHIKVEGVQGTVKYNGIS